jgi:hypothetical protein
MTEGGPFMRKLKVGIFFPIFSFWLVFIVSVPTNCFPWRKSVHKYMSWEATMVMPDDIHVILQNNMNSLLQGTINPDNIKVADHQNVSECARMIKKYAKIAKEMIRKGEDWEKIVFVLGQAAHYIQDLNQPQHSSNYEKGHEHRTFEECMTDFTI